MVSEQTNKTWELYHTVIFGTYEDKEDCKTNELTVSKLDAVYGNNVMKVWV